MITVDVTDELTKTIPTGEVLEATNVLFFQNTGSYDIRMSTKAFSADNEGEVICPKAGRQLTDAKTLYFKSTTNTPVHLRAVEL